MDNREGFKKELNMAMTAWLNLHPDSGRSFTELFEVSRKSKLGREFTLRFFEELCILGDMGTYMGRGDEMTKLEKLEDWITENHSHNEHIMKIVEGT